jgi:DNA-binding NtrC family response regulator
MTKLMIVDDDADLREMLKEFFEMSTSCLAVGSLAELEKVRDQALECTLAILDINLGAGQPSGLDVFEWLRKAGFRGRVAFVTGHADNHPLVRRAALEEGVKVYKKPMDIEALVELVKGE